MKWQAFSQITPAKGHELCSLKTHYFRQHCLPVWHQSTFLLQTRKPTNWKKNEAKVNEALLVWRNDYLRRLLQHHEGQPISSRKKCLPPESLTETGEGQAAHRPLGVTKHHTSCPINAFVTSPNFFYCTMDFHIRMTFGVKGETLHLLILRFENISWHLLLSSLWSPWLQVLQLVGPSRRIFWNCSSWTQISPGSSAKFAMVRSASRWTPAEKS